MARKFFVGTVTVLALCLFWVSEAPAPLMNQDPGDTCLGPDDPFCDDGSGSGGGGDSPYGSCEYCKAETIINAFGQPETVYVCEAATGPQYQNSKDCQAGMYGCTHNNYCSWV
jgi:hypothetical protein